MLTTIITGNSPEPPLLIAHGLFGSARNWGVLGKRLSDQRTVIAVDMRNHGTSPWQNSHTYQDLANDLAEVIEQHHGQADVLGHSMGGKAAMVLATSRPHLVRNLIVADIAPVPYGHTQNHLIAAMKAVDLNRVSKRSDADHQLEPHISEPQVRAFLLQSLDLRGDRPAWQLNLDILKAQMPDIIGFPELTQRFNGRTMFLTGRLSDYVLPEHHEEILRLFPKVVFHSIAGAGHWLHAEKPREFEAEVRAFLSEP